MLGGRKMKKEYLSITYFVTIVVYVFTIFTNYGEVMNNLEWYDSSYKVIYFIILCLIGIAISFKIIHCLFSKKDIERKICFLSIILTIFPYISHYIVEKLIGNVDSESMYITLRVLQGFEETYALLGILGLVGTVLLFVYKFNKK